MAYKSIRELVAEAKAKGLISELTAQEIEERRLAAYAKRQNRKIAPKKVDEDSNVIRKLQAELKKLSKGKQGNKKRNVILLLERNLTIIRMNRKPGKVDRKRIAQVTSYYGFKPSKVVRGGKCSSG
jgi:hypothetical protein